MNLLHMTLSLKMCVFLTPYFLCFQGSVWMECIQFEKIFGDKKHLRKRYERALEKTHDTPETVAK